MIVECECGRGDFDDDQYRSCYHCFLDRRESYLVCVFCGQRWHAPQYAACFTCRQLTPGRDDAARELRMDILQRDGFTCHRCGSTDLPQIDHVKPCARKGTAHPWNLQVLCRLCNIHKGATYNRMWMRRRYQLMCLYFTFGWGLLTLEERSALCDQARNGNEYGSFQRFSHYRESCDGFYDHQYSPDPPRWAIEMADADVVTIQEEFHGP